jgi:ATP-dependent DNA helicase RecG
VRNLYKYVRIYSGALPIFDEGDIFRLTVPLNAEHSPEGVNDTRTENPDRKPGQKVRTENPDRKPKIELVEQLLQLIQTTPKITQNEMVRLLGIARSTLNVHIDALKKSGRLRRVGPDKGGHWEVIG